MANNLINKVNIVNRNAELNINIRNDDIDCTVELCESKYLTLAECGSFLKAYNSYSFVHPNCRSLPRNFDSFSSLISHIEKTIFSTWGH